MTLKPFDRIHNTTTNEDIRILHLTEQYAIALRIGDLRRLELLTIGFTLLNKGLADGTYSLVEEPSVVVDHEILPPAVREKFLRNKAIVDAVTKEFGPDFIRLNDRQPKPLLDELIKTHHMARSTMLRIIYKYLQSGCKVSSLLKTPTKSSKRGTPTERKRGRKTTVEGAYGKNLTAADYENLEKFKRRYLASKHSTVRNCYDDMILDCYSQNRFNGSVWELQELPPDQCPSLRQFRYYIDTHTTLEERDVAKMGKREFRNNHRPLTGTALHNISGPGDVFEVDACELDIAAVSAEDRKKTVGSPVAYFMIDVYSKMIIGASLSFDNNSVVALTQCLASLVNDNAAIFASYGISLPPNKSGLTITDVMPSHIKPRTIRVDHGSDFISKEMQRIASENNIQIDYVSPATGSYKSIVERSFRSFQTSFCDTSPGYKDGVRQHNREAKLTIEEIRAMMYHFIYSHNMTQHQSKYLATGDMVGHNVSNIPAELWRYGSEKYGHPAYIPDRTQFLYTLLTPVKAKVTRYGIEYKSLRFIPDINKDIVMQTLMIAGKPVPVQIRIDPRDNSEVYYLRDGELYTAPMVDDINHRELAGMTWAEFEEHKKSASLLAAQKDIESGKLRRAIRLMDREIIKNAKAASGKGKSDATDMRETRLAEKTRVEKEHRLMPPEPPAEPPANEPPVTPVEPAVIDREAYLKQLQDNLMEEEDD